MANSKRVEMCEKHSQNVLIYHFNAISGNTKLLQKNNGGRSIVTATAPTQALFYIGVTATWVLQNQKSSKLCFLRY